MQESFTFENGWLDLIQEELKKPYMVDLYRYLQEERKSHCIYPKEEETFSALKYCPPEKVKVVIVGQDPYHGEGQAHGLSFSVNDGIAIPPSLKNIYKELQSDLGIAPPKSGNLAGWASQGVLLLNAILTVRQGEPLAHQNRGWEKFTDALLMRLCEQKRPLVFMLWGKYAEKKAAHIKGIEKGNRLILTSAHPSPLSAYRFFGCRHFSKANQFLESTGLKPINFSL